MSNHANLRIHPAIAIARVGNSEEFYLGPETMAASPGDGPLTGGLPIQPDTDATTITSRDLRDSQGRLKRQAARFRIFQYPGGDVYSYPAPAGREVTIGSIVDGKTVVDIIWTVHLANKKANCWEIDAVNTGILQYATGQVPPLRNPTFTATPDPADKTRLQKLVIDAGPRALPATKGTQGSLKFDKNTVASFYNATANQIQEQPNYPKSFPASDGGSSDYNASSQRIESLGEMLTERNGRLLVLGGFGKACGFDDQGKPDPAASLDEDVDNNHWLDDTADGPVTAVLVFDDGSHQPIEGSAWVVATDPAYAPQTLNVVTLWDDVYMTWLEQMGLDPTIYAGGKYNRQYKPYFPTDVFPILNAAQMQMWNTNLPDKAIQAHKNISRLTEEKPAFNILSFIRNPNLSEQSSVGAPLMPLSLGDSAKALLSVSTTQYFFMEQWVAGNCVGASPRALSQGEQLDKTILVNCLGGRFSPGIDLTFIVRDPNFYNPDWKNPAIGTFRVNAKAMDYTDVSPGQPTLGVGYIPLRKEPVEPGDVCKFMSIPWHTDYNSCATHPPSPNPGGDLTAQNLYSGTVNTSLFWSWPAQRPVAVYTFDDLVRNGGNLPKQRYSVRGEGTDAVQSETDSVNTPATKVGRYQNREDMLRNWHQIGIVLQGPAIDDYPGDFNKDYYLEVQSGFKQDQSNLVTPWPNTVTDKVFPPKS